MAAATVSHSQVAQVVEAVSHIEGFARSGVDVRAFADMVANALANKMKRACRG